MKKCLAWTLALCVSAISLFAATAEPIGEVIALEGTAFAVRADGKEHKLALKSPVFLNDRIITRESSRLQVMFLDDTIIAQGESAEMTLDEYIYTPAEKKKNGSSFGFVKGAFRSITGKITDLNPERFKVKTKMATIGIRGCDLGFNLQEGAEHIYIVRVPANKLIRIERDMRGGGARQETMNIRQSGVVVSLMQGRRMQRRAMTPDDLKAILDESTPGSQKQGGRRGSGDGDGEDGSDDDEQGGGEDGGSEGDAGTGGAGGDDGSDGLDGAGEQFDGYEGDMGGDSGFGSESGQGSDVGNTDTFSPDTSSLDDNVIDDPDPPPAPPDPPPPDPDPPSPTPPPDPDPQTAGITGKGLGADYSTDAGYYSRTQLYKYDSLEGELENNILNGTLSGVVMDRDETVTGGADSSLNDLAIIPFGGPAYEGYVENALTTKEINEVGEEVLAETGQYLAYDNLGQFFRYIDMMNPELRFAYGGYASADFGVSLPAGRVLKYDVKGLELDQDYFYGSAPQIRNGQLLVNTKTGAFMMLADDDDLAFFGTLDKLDFFGQEMQGVGITDIDAIAAGFLDNKTPAAAAESGMLDYKGYAVGSKERPLSPSQEMALGLLRSADEQTDNSDMAENRVRIGIDKDQPGNNVKTSVNVYPDPAATTENGLSLNNPDQSFFVKGQRAGAIWNGPDGEMTTELQTTDGGMDWSWGEWESELDAEGGDTRFDGFFAVGNTLAASAYQTIVNGPTAYNLSTPADSPGRAAAYVLNGYYRSYMDGVCFLNVNVPGNGAAPAWSGSFDMSRDLGTNPDMLQFSVSNGRIGPNGHLHGSADSYNLVLDGVAYGRDTITRQGVVGNLVGSGSGEKPITGAVGQFNMTHGSGPFVNGIFGADLSGQGVKASDNIHYAPE